MQIHVVSHGFSRSQALVEHVSQRIAASLARYRDRIEQVRVRLSDENGPRGGIDKRCRLQVTLRGLRPVRVQEVAADLYAAVSTAVCRSDRIVARALARQRAERHR